MDETDSLEGKLLIAMPGMGDPRFEHSVIFMCAHSEEGALGLIVNQPAPELKSASLIEHETIRTTVPKAKELRRVIEPLITLAKEDSVANRRLAFDRLRNKASVGKLFNELGPRFKERPGGYLRILKAGHRPGDAEPMAIVQLLDQPDTAGEEAAAE